MPLEQAFSGRQHGADHEGGDNRQKECLGDIENGHDADDEKGTSAKATTSTRLITGGSSALASGNGVAAACLEGARSLARTRNWLSPAGCYGWRTATSRNGPGSGGHNPHDREKVPSFNGTAGPRPRLFCIGVMRIASGQIMTRTFAGHRWQSWKYFPGNSLAMDQIGPVQSGA